MAVVLSGAAVLELVESAASRVVVVAPYIKSGTIHRLLRVLPNTVSEFVCITRWLPEDIASGACDLEIFDHVVQMQGGKLFVNPHLHAKYYSNGQKTLIGSTNLTSRGLGWHTPSNLEILVALPADFPGLAKWEVALLNSSVKATESLREQIRAKAEQLKQDLPVSPPPEAQTDIGEETTLWVPKCPVPDRLWEVYNERSVEDIMVSSSLEAAEADLAALSLPQGLTEKNLFTEYIVRILQQMPLLVEIDKLSSTGLTDTKAKEFLANLLNDSNGAPSDYDQTWGIIKRWLVHFFPKTYRLEIGQEVLVKGREITR